MRGPRGWGGGGWGAINGGKIDKTESTKGLNKGAHTHTHTHTCYRDLNLATVHVFLQGNLCFHAQ